MGSNKDLRGMGIDHLITSLQATNSVTVLKRVFDTSMIKVGDLVKVHTINVVQTDTNDLLQVDKDCLKGVVDFTSPDSIKIIVRSDIESEPSYVRITIDEVFDDSILEHTGQSDVVDTMISSIGITKIMYLVEVV